MQTTAHDSLLQPPRGFRYSLDWRFLLPLEDMPSIGILAEEDPDFDEALAQVGISSSQRLASLPVIRALVLPFGVPVSSVGATPEEQVRFFASARQMISPGGYLLSGFANSWGGGAGARSSYYPSTPGRMAAHLQQAGFRSVRLFGAMPSLSIPEYIFDLDPRSLRFALQNRFRRKPAVLRALRVFSAVIGMKPLSSFLPCYFALAKVEA